MTVIDELSQYSKEEAYEGIFREDTYDMALDIEVYLQNAIKKYPPETLLYVYFCCLPDENKFGRLGVYKIHKASAYDYVTHMVNQMRFSGNRQQRYVAVQEKETKIKLYDREEDKYLLLDWKQACCLKGGYVKYTPYFGTKEFNWYVITKDGEALRFSMKHAVERLGEINPGIEDIYNFRHKYIYDSACREKSYGYGTNQLECYAKDPKIAFNGGIRWFSLIDCEVPLVSRYANKQYLKEHYVEICEDLLTRIQGRAKYKKCGVPTNYLKVGSAILSQDNILHITFQLKIEEKADIYK